MNLGSYISANPESQPEFSFPTNSITHEINIYITEVFVLSQNKLYKGVC